MPDFSSFGFGSNRIWKLIPVAADNFANTEVIGQFLPESYSENVNNNFQISSTLGSEVPGIQWVNTNEQTINFKGRIFSNTSGPISAFTGALVNPLSASLNTIKNITNNLTVREKIDLLKLATLPVASFGRPARFTFTYGSEIAYEVFIKSVDNIVYDDIRSDGSIRGVSFNITLLRINLENVTPAKGLNVASLLKSAGASFLGARSSFGASVGRKRIVNVTGGSPHTVSKVILAKDGDTFEKIARREYGNPLLGDVLRRAQPDKTSIKAGDEIALISRLEITQIEVTPQSVALRDTIENRAVIEEFLTLRGRSASLRF